MKKVIKILLIILVLLVIFAAIATLTHQGTLKGSQMDEYTVIGNNSNGTVYKMICGNASSDDVAVVILGVHSLESGIHNATNESIINFTKDNDLNKKFIVYFIKLNFNDSGMNTSDYDTNRHMGELLANEYVLPDIEKYNPYVIVDVHEMESYWPKTKYIGLVENKSTVTKDYANRIGNDINYPVYPIISGSSPDWVSIPLAKKGHNVMLFETPQNDTQYKKIDISKGLVKAIDSLPAN